MLLQGGSNNNIALKELRAKHIIGRGYIVVSRFVDEFVAGVCCLMLDELYGKPSGVLLGGDECVS